MFQTTNQDLNILIFSAFLSHVNMNGQYYQESDFLFILNPQFIVPILSSPVHGKLENLHTGVSIARQQARLNAGHCPSSLVTCCTQIGTLW